MEYFSFDFEQRAESLDIEYFRNYFEQREQKKQTSNIFGIILGREESGTFLRRFEGRKVRCLGRFIYTRAARAGVT
jgi:hypothetical protein